MQMVMNRSEAMKQCIDDCLECYKTCAQTIAQCLSMGGEHAEAKHITIMDDCAKACNISADFMLRSSELDTHMCSLCAQACENCADSCDEFEEDYMKQCAQTCRKCADSCNKMAAEQR